LGDKSKRAFMKFYSDRF